MATITLVSPLVSVIIPTFDINKTESALLSVLNQDYINKEIIIVNDNPVIRPSVQLLTLINKNSIKLVNNPTNLGIARSLNNGIKASNGDVILIYCGDYTTSDRNWIKDSVEKLYSEEKIVHVVAAIETEDAVWKKYPFFLKLFTFKLMVTDSHGAGVSYKKDLFKKIGLFDWKTFRYAGEDGDMNYRLKESGHKIGYIDNIIVHCHCNSKDTVKKILKKEYHYGIGHGARKKKYGLTKRLGWFDFDIRLICLAGFLIGLFLVLWFGLSAKYLIAPFLYLLPFFLGALKLAIDPYKKTKWIPGLVLYPFAGILISFIQTIGATKGYLETKEDKSNKNVEYLK